MFCLRLLSLLFTSFISFTFCSVLFRGLHFRRLLRKRIFRSRMMENDICRNLREGGSCSFTTSSTCSMTFKFGACRFRYPMSDNFTVINGVRKCLNSAPILRFCTRNLTVTRSTASGASFLNGIVHCFRTKDVRVCVMNRWKRANSSNCDSNDKIAFHEAGVKVPFKLIGLFLRSLRFSFASNDRVFAV